MMTVGAAAARIPYNGRQVRMMTQPSVSSLRNMMNAVEQSPDLQQELRQWVIQLIRGSDDLRQDLRREILTDELLQLPVRFTRMEQDVGVLKEDVGTLKDDVAGLKEDVGVLKDDVAVLKDDVAVLKDDVAVLKDDVSALKDGQARLEQDVAGLRRDQARMSGHISNLRGADYERMAVERSRRLIRRLHGMEKSTLVNTSRRPAATFEAEILIPAIRSGRITRDEADDLEDADCILRLDDPEKATIYAVVEISITVQETDRVRAARRAEVFSRAVEVEARAYVVGEQEELSGDAISRVTFVEYPPEYPAEL